MNRREFSRLAGWGALALQTVPYHASASVLFNDRRKSDSIPLGVGNHSLRTLRPNARELIEYAMNQKLDSVQFNTLKPFESLDAKHLDSLKNLAKSNKISIYIGVGSICEQSVAFSNSYGDARTLVKEGIRVARLLGSPIIGVRIGLLNDRYTGGGIAPKMEEVIKLMKSFRGPVQEAGLKFAFENHAGDMRSEELLELIDQTGSDICGAFFDPGNAIYAMEDPKVAMETVGKHIICCQARDVVAWQVEDGAMFQWTAVGEGMMDFKHYTSFLRQNCPGVPIHIETISNSPRSIPYLRSEYWDGFPDLHVKGIIDFLKIVHVGHPIEAIKAPKDTDKKSFEIENQRGELMRSIEYLSRECGAGLKR